MPSKATHGDVFVVDILIEDRKCTAPKSEVDPVKVKSRNAMARTLKIEEKYVTVNAKCKGESNIQGSRKLAIEEDDLVLEYIVEAHGRDKSEEVHEAFNTNEGTFIAAVAEQLNDAGITVEPSKIHLTVKATAVIADEGFKAVGKAVGRAVASSGGSPLKAAAAAAQAATVNGGTATDAADVAAATASDLGASKTTIMKAAGDAAAVAVIDAGGSAADAVKASAAAAASAGGSTVLTASNPTKTHTKTTTLREGEIAFIVIAVLMFFVGAGIWCFLFTRKEKQQNQKAPTLAGPVVFGEAEEALVR